MDRRKAPLACTRRGLIERRRAKRIARAKNRKVSFASVLHSPAEQTKLLDLRQ